MQVRKAGLVALSVAIFLMAMTSIASAASFSSVIVYGDSLSDNGKLYSLDAGIYPPSPPYYNGRLSNGPVAVEQLAALLGAPLVDFAIAGATTGVGNYIDNGTQTSVGMLGLPGMRLELASSASVLSSPIVPSSLFVVWGGANDFLTAGSPLVAEQNIVSIVDTLEADGATHILVPGVPDLGITPDFLGTALQAAATAYAQIFNTALQANLPSGAKYVDTFNLLRQIEQNPGGYGFTDATDPCYNSTTLTVCSNPNKYVFWDGFHPTAAADAIVAQNFANAALVPEPSTMLLLGTGIPGLMMLVRRRRAA